MTNREAIKKARKRGAMEEKKSGQWTEKEVLSDTSAIEEWQSAKCSVCGKYHTTPYMYYFERYPYCPHCGARMEGNDGATDKDMGA